MERDEEDKELATASRPHPPAAPDPAAVHPDLPGVIRQFRDRHGQLNDPLFAHDRAEAFSAAFAAACQEHGISATVVSGMKTGEHPLFPGRPLILGGNFAVLVPFRQDLAGHDGDPEDGIAIDWTARQYNPSVPVPAITSVADWRREWPAFGTGQAAGPPGTRNPEPGPRAHKPSGTRQAGRRPGRRP